MSRLFVALTIFLDLSLGVFLPQASQAATINTLVKGSGQAIYWYANDGRRYAFPNLNTFLSWYNIADFSRVQTISDPELFSLLIGGNVTYRPGYRLVKRIYDPKVYAVSRYGVLRWVTNESLAQSLYGYDWTQRVDDIPEAFFSDYTIGSPIYSIYDYSVVDQLNGVSNPSDSLTYANNGYGIPSYYPPYQSASPAPATFTGSLTLSASRSDAGMYDGVNFTAQLSNPYPDAGLNIAIYDAADDHQIASCQGVLSCNTGNLTFTRSDNTFFQVQFYAVASNAYGQRLPRAYSQIVTIRPSAANNLTGSVWLSVHPNQARTGDPIRLRARAQVDQTGQDIRVELYNQDGALLQTCYHATDCRVSTTIPAGVYGQYGFYARAINQSGQTLQSDSYQVQINATPTPPPPPPSQATAISNEVSPTTSNLCGQTFAFSGKISASTAGQVQYVWERSDGATAQVQTATFYGSGVQTVNDTWTIGQSYGGWERLHVISPNDSVSNQADFRLICP